MVEIANQIDVTPINLGQPMYVQKESLLEELDAAANQEDLTLPEFCKATPQEEKPESVKEPVVEDKPIYSFQNVVK